MVELLTPFLRHLRSSWDLGLQAIVHLCSYSVSTSRQSCLGLSASRCWLCPHRDPLPCGWDHLWRRLWGYWPWVSSHASVRTRSLTARRCELLCAMRTQQLNVRGSCQCRGLWVAQWRRSVQKERRTAECLASLGSLGGRPIRRCRFGCFVHAASASTEGQECYPGMGSQTSPLYIQLDWVN